MGSCVHIEPIHDDVTKSKKVKTLQNELSPLDDDILETKYQSSQTTNSSESSMIGIDEMCHRYSVPSHSVPSKSVHCNSNMTNINLNNSSLEVIADDQNDKKYSDDTLDTTTKQQQKQQQIITNGKEELDSEDDDTKQEHSSNESEQELNEPMPSKQIISKQKQTRNSIQMIQNEEEEEDIVTIQQLSDISFKCIQSSHATQAGTKNGKSKTNQDSFICLDSFGPSSLFQLFGVCDGHGPNGHDVSQYAVKHLPIIINKLLTESINTNLCIPNILKQAFVQIEQKLNQEFDDNLLDFDINYSGTTATIGLFAGNKLYIANLGDSRTVLGVVDHQRNVPIAIALSIDHDPKNEEEMLRIKECKTCKILFDDDNDARIQIEIPQIIQDSALLAVSHNALDIGNNDDMESKKEKITKNHRRTQSQVKKISASVSRSIGDVIAHKYGGLISEPQIKIHELSDNDLFVIFASDGIWQMIENDDVMRMVGTKLNAHKLDKNYEDLDKTTQKLVREANISWQDEYEDYTDDITAVIARIAKI